MIISGNVGIGTTSPTARLEVGGTSGTDGIKFPDGSQQNYSGKVINLTYRTNCTRSALTPASSITMESFAVNKKSSTSLLVIQGSISGRGATSGDMQQAWKLGTGTEALAQAITYTATSYAYAITIPTTAVIAGQTTTGSQTMVFRFYAANGSNAESPFTVYNPNGSDNGRLGQSCSTYIVTEVEPN